jgi:hypothetical protein
MPRVEISEAAAPVSRAVEKVRLFIITILFLYLRVELGVFPYAAWAPRFGAGYRDI